MILLASQQIELFSEQLIHASTNLDVSYTSFGTNARSSTQKPQTPPPTQNEAEDLDEFFIDDMENDFPNLTNFVGTAGVNIDNEINSVENFDSEPMTQFNNFKMPTITKNIRTSQVPSTSKAALQIPSSSSQTQVPYTSKKDRENTVHVNMLQSSLEKVRKEHTKLKMDFSEITNKIQTKDGENSMLRYELNIIKKQNEQYRLAKIQENENVKREWLEKIKNLEKESKAKETEMEFQNIEMSNMKNRKLNDTIKNLDIRTCEVKEDFSKFESIFSLNIPISYEKPLKIVLNSCIFRDSLEQELKEKSINRINLSIKDSIHLKNLKTIQSVLAQFISENNSSFLSEKILAPVLSSLKELKKYALHMEYSKYTDLQSNPRMEHNFLCEMSGPEYELFEGADIFSTE